MDFSFKTIYHGYQQDNNKYDILLNETGCWRNI